MCARKRVTFVRIPILFSLAALYVEQIKSLLHPTAGTRPTEQILLTQRRPSPYRNEALHRRQDIPTSEMSDVEAIMLGAGEENDVIGPNKGYEPYWAGGDWVFEPDTNDTKSCAKPCSVIDEKYGVICGRSQNNTRITYNNYCEMQNSNCMDKNEWMIAYRGPCRPEIPLYPASRQDLADWAPKFVKDFDKIAASIVAEKLIDIFDH